MNIYFIENKEVQQVLKFFESRRKFSHLPGTVNAIAQSVKFAKQKWVNIIISSTAKKGWGREYIKTIDDDFDNPLSATVFADDKNMYVNFIENGIKRFDMKPGLLGGKNAAKHGGKFAIVGFKHGTPGAQNMDSMPVTIYTKVKNITKSDIMKSYKVIGIGENLNLTTKKRVHNKANSLKDLRGSNSGKTSKYEGLMKSGSKDHSQYVTFRVVSKNSTGWINPGSPKVNIFNTVVRKVKPGITKIMNDGIKLDTEAGFEYLNGK